MGDDEDMGEGRSYPPLKSVLGRTRQLLPDDHINTIRAKHTLKTDDEGEPVKEHGRFVYEKRYETVEQTPIYGPNGFVKNKKGGVPIRIIRRNYPLG